MMNQKPWTEEELSYIIQFQHPEKILGEMPGINQATTLAAIFGVTINRYLYIKSGFAERARQAAVDLLADADFAALVDQLPVALGSTIVGLGDSITDDDQSWLEILRHLFDLRRLKDNIKVVNAGISGDTTSQVISRFLDVTQKDPALIICMAGTNDTRLHGQQPTKTLVSLDETKQNLAMLRNFATTQTTARWVWMTPTPVIEAQIADHWYLGPRQMMWSNKDIKPIAEFVLGQPEPVIDLQALFGSPPNPAWLMDDGLHPSLAGQQAIVKALVTQLVNEH